ncbi:PH domain-containing protein [Alkalihalobacillus hemicellulosilyticus]|uniref:Bacterial Pleckstrin homology domain-containing protein n=1 Tax=Halalkalibacter hemicellulosilyticusJCM 9152 TaxID=1236971 RepID=W4QN36_9BACI|nr:PH domain-containing protein [Halalkalibacter hemicellulosilyticus]GAE32764.1 hypothetical protein JCM9152_4326 [Halalkalibacter hemicellulosilyticusJCM 9152]
MFKKMAADALGLSDIGKVIHPNDFNQTDANDFIREAHGEKIYFLIKTKADEYCFTNLALIHIDGENAVTSKRTMRRYPYYKFPIDNVSLETAGRIDLDVEIIFNIGDEKVTIAIARREVEYAKQIYRALLHISEIIYDNQVIKGLAEKSLEHASRVLQHVHLTQNDLLSEYKKVDEYTFDRLREYDQAYRTKDFTDIFEQYIYLR